MIKNFLFAIKTGLNLFLFIATTTMLAIGPVFSVSASTNSVVFTANDSTGNTNLWGYSRDTNRAAPVAMTNPNGFGMIGRYETFEYNNKVYGLFVNDSNQFQFGEYDGAAVTFFTGLTLLSGDELEHFTVFNGNVYAVLEGQGEIANVL